MDLSAKSSTILGEDASSSTFSVGEIRRFPIAFNIYYTKTQSVNTSIFHLGEHQAQPLYAATFHVSWTGKSDVTLHDGPDTGAPTLATAETERLLSINSIIKIPALHSGSAISEQLRVEYHLTGPSHHFSVPSIAGNDALPERFEWRQSHRDGSWGWKLVRTTSKVTYGTAEDPNSRTREVASDGKEVVAKLVDNTVYCIEQQGGQI